ncbi:hypothetical protein IAR50_000136 [Cryptococcus sp. DSM 104548]
MSGLQGYYGEGSSSGHHSYSDYYTDSIAVGDNTFSGGSYAENPFGEEEEDEDDFLDPEEEARQLKHASDRGLRNYVDRQKDIHADTARLKETYSSSKSRGSGGSESGSSSSQRKKTAKKPKHKPAKKPSASKSRSSQQTEELADIGEEEE